MSLWQTKQWSEMLKKTGQVDSNIRIGDVGIQKRGIGFGQFGLFIMGVSPDVTIDNRAIIEICKREKCLFIQVEFLDYSGQDLSQKIEQFSEGYYKKFITPYTAIIDLEKSEDEILANMKPKGRYNIRLAEKKGIVSEIVEKNDENIKLFYDLSRETTKRDNFSGHSYKYYKFFLKSIENSELILASKDGEVIAGGIFVFSEDVSYYYYGASTSKKEFRNLMAPYSIQWKAIQYAKQHGSKVFDFLGIAGEGSDYDASLAGVTDFKMKLTPSSIKVSTSQIYVSRKILFFLITTIKNIKSRLK